MVCESVSNPSKGPVHDKILTYELGNAAARYAASQQLIK